MYACVLIILAGIVLILVGLLKLLSPGAEDMPEELDRARLLQHKTLISVTAVVWGSPVAGSTGLESLNFGGVGLLERRHRCSYDDAAAFWL